MTGTYNNQKPIKITLKKLLDIYLELKTDNPPVEIIVSDLVDPDYIRIFPVYKCPFYGHDRQLCIIGREVHNRLQEYKNGKML